MFTEESEWGHQSFCSNLRSPYGIGLYLLVPKAGAKALNRVDEAPKKAEGKEAASDNEAIIAGEGASKSKGLGVCEDETFLRSDNYSTLRLRGAVQPVRGGFASYF